jgi:osmotically-inducible protein OsmY
MFTRSPHSAEAFAIKTDLDLRQDVERELAWDPRVDASNIAVTAKNGVVTLAGQVRSYLDKWEAENLLKHIAGVAGIADDVEVTLGGAKPDDTDLTERVLHALEANVFVPSETVKPIVLEGVVTLRGKALYYYQKRYAEDAVRPLRGVKGIIDEIVIDNPAEPREVSRKITDALVRNARVDARQIAVKVNGRTAILEGVVRSLAERDEAEAAAWAAPGVNSVENQLVVRY